MNPALLIMGVWLDVAEHGERALARVGRPSCHSELFTWAWSWGGDRWTGVRVTGFSRLTSFDPQRYR